MIGTDRYRSKVSRYEYDLLQEKIDSMNEAWRCNQDYWLAHTRKLELERDVLRSSLKIAVDPLTLVRKGISGVGVIIDCFLTSAKKTL